MFFSVPNLFGYIKIFISGDQFNILDWLVLIVKIVELGHLTLLLPWVTKKEFLLTISIQYKA